VTRTGAPPAEGRDNARPTTNEENAAPPSTDCQKVALLRGSLDRLGIDKVYIQAKRYAQTTTVSRQDVQAFSGALDDKQTTRGVFITTSSFSSGALAYVKNITKQIVLIDGHRLAQLMIRHGVGVRVERVMEIKRVDEDFFEDT